MCCHITPDCAGCSVLLLVARSSLLIKLLLVARSRDTFVSHGAGVYIARWRHLRGTKAAFEARMLGANEIAWFCSWCGKSTKNTLYQKMWWCVPYYKFWFYLYSVKSTKSTKRNIHLITSGDVFLASTEGWGPIRQGRWRRKKLRRLFCHLHISYSALRTTESVLPIRWKVLQVVFTLRFANALWWSHSDCAYITACLLWVASCAPLQLETRMSVGFILSRILNLSLNQGSHYRLSVTVYTATACVLYFAYCQCSAHQCYVLQARAPLQLETRMLLGGRRRWDLTLLQRRWSGI